MIKFFSNLVGEEGSRIQGVKDSRVEENYMELIKI
jgi:hypothetical protein